MPRKSLFHIETGRLVGTTMEMPEAAFALPENTPPGHAWVDGDFDHLALAAALITDDFGDGVGVVRHQQPPPPPSDEWITWVWDQAAARYQEQPTQKALELRARQLRDRLLLESDWIVSRSTDQAIEVPPEWLAYREALRNVPAQPGFPTAIDWPQPPTP